MDKNKLAKAGIEGSIGLVSLVSGLYIFSQKIMVYNSWQTLRIGGLGIPSGLVVVPFIIGVIWMVAKPKAILPKVVAGFGVLFVIITVIMNVSFRFYGTTLFDYLLILGLISVGVGLMIKGYICGRGARKDD